MADKTAISWTRGGSTWNPIGGTAANWICRKISPGCEPCYASERNRSYSGIPFADVGQPLLDTPRLKEHILHDVYRWKEGRMVFPGSMTDLWGQWVPQEWQDRIYRAAIDNPQHIYQWLTKRPSLMVQSMSAAQRAGIVPDPLPDNWWIGTTVELPRYLWRAALLNGLNASVRWLSLEPLYLDRPWPTYDPRQFNGIHWHVVGGVSGLTEYARERYLVEKRETGWQPKPGREEWVRAMREAAQEHGVTWFFKQWGGPRPDSGGHLLDGKEWHAWPADLPQPVAATA